VSNVQSIEGERAKRRPRSFPERFRGHGSQLRRLTDLVREGPFSESFLRDRIAEGSLKSFKVGRGRFVYQSDWEAFLSGLSVPRSVNGSGPPSTK
jgi:hypothetical protein